MPNDQGEKLCWYVPGKSMIDSVTVLDGGRKVGTYGGQTLEELREEYPDAIEGTYDQCTETIEAALISEPVEIDEGRFTYANEVVPPGAWQICGDKESFYMGEPMSGNIAGTYVRIGERYFSFYDRMTLNHFQRVEKVLNSTAYKGDTPDA